MGSNVVLSYLERGCRSLILAFVDMTAVLLVRTKLSGMDAVALPEGRSYR